MPITGYDEAAARINRQRGPWWHKWLFVIVALRAAGLTGLVVRLLQ